MSSSDIECEEWLPLAKYMANKYRLHYGYKEFDDAYQDACIGLVKALRTWKGGTEGKSAYLARAMMLTMWRNQRKPQIKTCTLNTGLLETLVVEDDTLSVLDSVCVQYATKRLSVTDQYRLHIILKNDVVFREAAKELGISKQRLSQVWIRIKEKLRPALDL